MRLREIHAILQTVAPERLAEPWDKVGIQIGDSHQIVRRGLLCIDLTRAVIDEAIRLRATLIVAYHPPIFHPITSISTAADADRVSYTVMQAMRHGLAIYSPHTALDSAVGGVNDWLAQRIGGPGATIRPIVPAMTPAVASKAFKVIAFTPTAHADAVRAAMAAACAGRIGSYTECSFNVRGAGTFRPGKGAKPFIGKAGKLERVEEIRTEMLCLASDLPAVVAALRRTHPYEEPAFDIVRVEPEPTSADDSATLAGQGRNAQLAKPISVTELVARVKRALRVRNVEVAIPSRGSAMRRVRTLAFAAGAGGSILKKAGGAEAWITGELPHHDVLAALDAGKVVLTAGHTQTERPYLPTYARRLASATGSAVQWRVSRADRAPSAIR